MSERAISSAISCATRSSGIPGARSAIFANIVFSLSRIAAGCAAAHPAAASTRAAISASWLWSTAASLDHGIRFVFDRLHHAAQRQQPVDARRRRLDLACQLVHQDHQLSQGLAIDPHYRGLSADHGEGGGEVASAETLRQQRSKLGLQRIETRRQPKPQIERLAVDALDLPNPADAEFVALRPRKARHADNTQIHRS